MKPNYQLILFMLLLVPSVSAMEGHIPLLAVKETDTGFEGSHADLYLEIKEGKGRVFLDTFPLTKLDTQMSTRFAKEIACDHLDINCNKYDFIYTIESNSAIVGGPSAGAAETLLAISLLSNLELGKKMTITGTINSGGLIGPVGGLKEKIDAGARIGLKKILIPRGRRFIEEQEMTMLGNLSIGFTGGPNNTIDLVKYGSDRGVEVVEVSDLDDAIAEITGIVRKESKNITLDPTYTEVMKGLATDLCNRTREFEAALVQLLNLDMGDELIAAEIRAKNLTNAGIEAFKEQKYYATASYCFGANVKYNYLVLALQEFTKEELKIKIKKIQKGLSSLDKSISSKKISTITDLESYMVVKERLIEAANYLNQSTNVSENLSLYDISYGIERLYSAYSWNNFFGKPGKRFDLNKNIIKRSCMEKLSEAEERYQYVNLYFPSLQGARRGLNLAYIDLENNNYELCLFKAAKAKAEANHILNLFGIKEQQLDVLIDTKLEIIKKNIAEEIEEGIFPILGYSYFEYASSLKEGDKLSALLYLEYALELSNLNIYFEESGIEISTIRLNKKLLITFAMGAATGFLIAFVLKINRKTKKRRKKRS